MDSAIPVRVQVTATNCRLQTFSLSSKFDIDGVRRFFGIERAIGNLFDSQGKKVEKLSDGVGPYRFDIRPDLLLLPFAPQGTLQKGSFVLVPESWSF